MTSGDVGTQNVHVQVRRDDVNWPEELVGAALTRRKEKWGQGYLGQRQYAPGLSGVKYIAMRQLSRKLVPQLTLTDTWAGRPAQRCFPRDFEQLPAKDKEAEIIRPHLVRVVNDKP